MAQDKKAATALSAITEEVGTTPAPKEPNLAAKSGSGLAIPESPKKSTDKTTTDKSSVYKSDVSQSSIGNGQSEASWPFPPLAATREPVLSTSPGATLSPTLPPPLPGAGADTSPEAVPPEPPQRRVARRRPAGPVRSKIAANDDAPSIGGLIYALDQKPSTKPFKVAGIASAIWILISAAFAWAIVNADLQTGASLADILSKPATFITAAAVLVPTAILWFLALLSWRSEELRLRSSTMAEVAIRLAEPDRMAEQSVASLGQAVRRQVAFMNDAITRALGRAGELEALVHNEVSALERSYEENEQKIRGLINELSGERHALVNTSERVTDTLQTLGTDIPELIDKLSNQQLKLAHIIKGAGENLTALETAVGASTDQLETTLGTRTGELQTMLEQYTSGLSLALGSRTNQLQDAISEYVDKLDTSLSTRTENLQAVFEEYAVALDTSLTNRAEALDMQLVERTKALDTAFGQRLKSFDDSIMRSTMAVDDAISDKAQALSASLEHHVNNFGQTMQRQAIDLDETLMQGITSVRRTSENVTRQSLKAIEGLAGQSEVLKNVSETLLSQINTATDRFEGQGQAIEKVASSLEDTNYKIDATLQGRHAQLAQTLDRLSGKADEFGRFVEGYSSNIEGSISSAEQRARATTEQIRLTAEAAKRSALADIERFRVETGAEGDRALEELRQRFSSISNIVNEQLKTLSTRFDQTSDDVRQRAVRAAKEIAAEQSRLRTEIEGLPSVTRESAEGIRRALHDQLSALDQLSNLANRSVQHRDVTPPTRDPGRRALSSLSASVASELANRGRAARQPDTAPRTQPHNAGQQRHAASGATPEQRDTWTLGDLLARASRDDDSTPAPYAPSPGASSPGPGRPFQHHIDVIARALDPATTSAIWSRINAGQQGVMVRSIYTPEGRQAFDELSLRLRSDPELQRTVNHYLADFEQIRRDAEHRDPTGRLTQSHLHSDMGRVYLFLAHLTGRLG
jgi:hypothetical protein